MNGFFRIITPVYNAEKWIGKCIKSVLSQTDQLWTQIVYIDGATDNTYQEALLAASGDPRITIINLPVKQGICNSHMVAHIISPKGLDDVFVHLDGDDYLLNDSVLNYIRNIYNTHEVLATYGNYVTKTGEPSICRPVDYSEGIRPQILKNWPFSHIRTFKAQLFNQLNLNDFTDRQGNFYTAAVDVAIFAPILEKCRGKIYFIQKPLYFYNNENPLNESKAKLQEQVRCALDICYKKK